MNKKIVGIVVSATAAVALSACGGTDTNRADITPEGLQAPGGCAPETDHF